MPFQLKWAEPAASQYAELRVAAKKAFESRQKKKDKKQGKVEGLFKQVDKTVKQLAQSPKHPGLQTHEYSSLQHPYDTSQKVFEAYAQNKTPGAYRVFWCYGPAKGEITIIAITSHP